LRPGRTGPGRDALWRALVAGLTLTPLLGGCGGDPYKIPPIVAGVVRLDAALADAAGNPTGTRRTTIANGIRVWLIENGSEIDSTVTLDGAYAFRLKKGHTYRTRVRLTPAFADSLPLFTPDANRGFEVDTLLLEHRGDLSSRPNPFTGQVALQFQIAAPGHVDLRVFDLAAVPIRTLVSLDLPAGLHQVTWDGLDDAGHAVRNGLFWVLFETAGETRADCVIKEP